MAYTSTAILSPDGAYRYELRRLWDGVLPFLYVGALNPSYADAEENDHTVRKLLGFAERLGLGGIVVWNLYAYRATDPGELMQAALTGRDMVGPDNDRHLRRLFIEVANDPASRLVAAWGSHPPIARVNEVLDLARSVGVFERFESWGVTKAGQPRHPVRIGYRTPLARWPAAAA